MVLLAFLLATSLVSAVTGGRFEVNNPDRAPIPEPATDAAATGIIGFGKASLGGTGGRIIDVHSVSEFRSAADETGPRIIKLVGSGTWDLAATLQIKDPYVTILGDPHLTIRGGELRIRTHDVIINGYRAAIGDLGMTSSQAADADALTLNGLAGYEVSNVVIRNSTMIWGPDIGGMAILGNVHDVTIQDNVIGEGLKYSRHPEGKPPTGHSKALAMFQLHPDETAPARITIARNLITRSDERMPVIMGATEVDLVNNLIYDWGIHGPRGNPRDLNVVGNYLRPGPDSRPRLVWEPRTHREANPVLYPKSVYLAGNVMEGSAGQPVGTPSTVYASIPGHSLSIVPQTAVAARDYVLANAGASRGPLESRIIGDVVNGHGGFFNGAGYPAPNPSWP